jgi:hypothetical protein
MHRGTLKPIPNCFVVPIRAIEDYMTTPADNPAYWLGRAKDAREIAGQVPDPEMKAILEEIAKGYERISEMIGYASSKLDDGQI